jgi:hypothetical protein
MRKMDAAQDPKALRPYNCAICGHPASMRCAKCRNTYYCGEEHQKQDWKGHKKVCTAPSASSSTENELICAFYPRSGNAGVVQHFHAASRKLIISDALSDMSVAPLAEVDNEIQHRHFPRQFSPDSVGTAESYYS